MTKELEKQMEVKENPIVTFLTKTKNGEFAPIDPSSLMYSRIEYLAEPDYDEEAYSFSFAG